ncbi:26S proteasome non-ATPase regulatory subunit 10, partial [Tetrabaena socialis]
IGNTALHYASGRGQTEVVEALLRAGADVAAKNNASWGWGVLLAGRLGGRRTDTGQGAGLSLRQQSIERSECGQTALHRASMFGHTVVVEALLRAGADTAAADDMGNTALHFASEGSQTEVVEALLRAGADVAAKND